jgi:hypothetical protein
MLRTHAMARRPGGSAIVPVASAQAARRAVSMRAFSVWESNGFTT